MYKNPARNHLLLFLYLFTLLLETATPMSKNTSFRVPLIHRYSNRFPFYNRNLTESQILESLVKSSASRVRWLESNTVEANITELIRPPLVVKRYLYMVPLSIGTGEGKLDVHLSFDTGSSLTWVLCNPCAPCFEHPSSLFDGSRSPTYKRLGHAHPMCTTPYFSDRHGFCAYDTRYIGGTTAKGTLSKDVFTFPSDRGGRDEVARGLVFGCTHSSTVGDNEAVGEWDGILGMGNMPDSFPRQIIDRTRIRFSYCLVAPLTNDVGFVQFGDEPRPIQRGMVQRTPIITHQGFSHYYLTLNDISFCGQRLHLPPTTFARQRDGQGDCFIDTGSTVTFLIKSAFDAVQSRMIRYFSRHRLQRRPSTNLDPCYTTPENYRDVLPDMTLHFQGADLHVGGEKLFMIHNERGVFCWAMKSSNFGTILGAHQQYNIQFSFDIPRGRLSFAPHNCGGDE